LHSETTPATQLANSQEDVLSPNESQAIRGRFIEVWARAAAESLPAPKNFFAKTSFAQRLPPLWDRTIFGQVFVRGGMIKFSK
jgi:hypothetical protein